MKIEQLIWKKRDGWQQPKNTDVVAQAQLVFLFGAYDLLKQSDAVEQLQQTYPQAYVFGCSTGGAVLGAEVVENALVATAIWFERTSIRVASLDFDSSEKSGEVGAQLAQELQGEDLRHIFVLSDGLHIHGGELVRGFAAHVPEGVRVTGGLAGDSELFEDTLVIANSAGKNRRVTAVGLYGKDLECGYGFEGGMASFGPSRRATRVQKNMLYEIDGEPALDLYKRYLGDMANGLPAAAVYFPLNVKMENSSMHLVRTVTSIDEEKGALIFAANIPHNSIITMMHANTDRLVDGAEKAGLICHESLNSNAPQLSLIVSCAARKMVLKQRVEEEVEAVRDALKDTGVQAGFYSFGEICPSPDALAACEFHNQTMTISTFREREN